MAETTAMAAFYRLSPFSNSRAYSSPLRPSSAIRRLIVLSNNTFSRLNSSCSFTFRSTTHRHVCSSSNNDGIYSSTIEEDDDDDDEDDVVDVVLDMVDDVAPSNLPDRWDVLGLGQAMVDFSGMVNDEFLMRLDLEKGTRKVVNHEERGRVLQAMDGCSYKAAAGGSLSNTLVALARLGGHAMGDATLNVAMAGSIGSDPLGGFYR